MWPGGIHTHVAALVLDDGRIFPADDAMLRIDLRSEAFCVVVDGQPVSLAVERCALCSMDCLCTTHDSATRQHLLRLPD